MDEQERDFLMGTVLLWIFGYLVVAGLWAGVLSIPADRYEGRLVVFAALAWPFTFPIYCALFVKIHFFERKR